APGLLSRYQGNPPGLASHRQRLHEQRDRRVHEATAGPV
ncbi:MAG: hypothetical protein, partial [Olavius algarvensis Gamma 1 endosymbiont]